MFETIDLTQFRAMRGLLACAALSLAAGCATTGGDSASDDGMNEPIRMEPVAEFAPMTPRSYIAAGQARYRNLYAPESYALWVTDLVAREKMARDESTGETVSEDLVRVAQLTTNNFILIECRLESEFADSSVAYDAVGMRSVDVYLENDSGVRVSPVQRVIGTHADETPVRALVRFGRTTILIFPRGVALGPPGEPAPARMRLVLEGYHSTFYFPWTDVGDAGVQVSAVSTTGALDAGFVELFSLLRRIVDIID